MYQSLQACRAIAAALVVLFHLGGTFAQEKYFGFKALDIPFSWADAGVDFFFVLSGFLITVTHRQDFGRPQALGAYVFKRALRIYPTYWLICLAVCLASLAVPSLRQSLPGDAMTLLKGLALIPQDPAVVGGTGSPILFVAWSLQYEMLFYAVIATFIAGRTAGTLVVALLLSAYLGCRLDEACGFPQSFLSSNLIFLFALGVAAAYVSTSRWFMPRPRLVAALATAGFVAFGGFEVWHGRDSLLIDRRLVYGALSSLIIVALAQAEAEGRLVVRGKLVKLLGDSSYSLYLLHIPVISLLCKLALALGVTGRPAQVVAFALIFFACIATSVIFHLMIERRLLAMFRSRARRGFVPTPRLSEPVVPLKETPGRSQVSLTPSGGLARSDRFGGAHAKHARRLDRRLDRA